MLDDNKYLVHKYMFTNFTSNSSKLENTYLYNFNEPCDYFILIIEGCLLLEAGEERTQFLVKQFDYFGTKALLGMSAFFYISI